MRHRIATGRAIIALLVVVGIFAAPTTAASATPSPQGGAASGEGVDDPLTGKAGPGTDGLPQIPLPYDCYVQESPEPTYSSATQTLQWGVKYLCSEVTVTWVKAELQQKEGSTWYTQDTIEKNFVASDWGSPPRAVACLGRTNHYWRVRAWVTMNGIPGIPNPGYSITYTRPCE
jgi:hypothetical protein